MNFSAGGDTAMGMPLQSVTGASPVSSSAVLCASSRQRRTAPGPMSARGSAVGAGLDGDPTTTLGRVVEPGLNENERTDPAEPASGLDQVDEVEGDPQLCPQDEDVHTDDRV